MPSFWRYVHRLIPVSGSCLANIAEIQSLCRRLFKPAFEAQDNSQTIRVSVRSRLTFDTTFKVSQQYKIEARIRNHTTLGRPLIIQEIAKCVPERCTVDLEDPQLVILVEVFKVGPCSFICVVEVNSAYQSVCGISVVEDYYRFKKFNILEIANERNGEKRFKESEGRVHDKEGVRQHTHSLSA